MARTLANALLGVVLVTLLAFAAMDRGSTGSLGARWSTFAHELASQRAAGVDTRARFAGSPLELAAARLPMTLALAGGAWALALLCGVPAGVWAGLREDSRLRALARALLVLAASVPVACAVVALREGVMAGEGATPWRGVWAAFVALALPAIAAVADGTARRTLQLARAEHILAITAQGLPAPARIARIVHALSVTETRSFFLLLQVLLASAVVAESAFGVPGAGGLAIVALHAGDGSLFAASVLLVGCACVAAHGLGMLVHALREPRMPPVECHP